MALLTSIIGWLREQKQIFCVGVSALLDSKSSLQGADQLWHMFKTGGLLVCTPAEGQPRMATLLQPDGDIVISLAASLFDQTSPEDRSILAVRHQQQVQEAIAPLRRLAGNARALEALLIVLRRYSVGGTIASVPVLYPGRLLGFEAFRALPFTMGMLFLGITTVIRPVVTYFMRRRMSSLRSQVRRQMLTD